MTLVLYSHPFSSYCQKVLIALWENELSFVYRHLEEPSATEERAALWPLGRFPVLVDDGRTVVESSIIIEHLDIHHAGPVRLLPDDRAAALEVRFMDRFFDNYVMTAMQQPVFEALRADAARKAEAMADCAAAPSLFYADWVHQIGVEYPRVRAYRARLLSRPSFARAVNEARPYHSNVPPGAPDRD